MFVRQLIGRQAGAIVDMPYADAKANLNAGTCAEATPEEIEAAGHEAQSGFVEVTPEALLAGYRIEPNIGGGFDLFDPGGVKVSEEPFHNHIAAREGAIAYSRRARGMPDAVGGAGDPGGGGAGGDVTPPDYETMTVEELSAEAGHRKLVTTGISLKADWIALLRHDDKVRAALAARDFDALTVADLEKVAAAKGIDVTSAKKKADYVDIFDAQYRD